MITYMKLSVNNSLKCILGVFALSCIFSLNACDDAPRPEPLDAGESGSQGGEAVGGESSGGDVLGGARQTWVG